MRKIERNISERLSRYTDLGSSEIDEVARQVLIALDIDNEPYPTVTTEEEQSAEIERNYDLGVKNGMDTERERIGDEIERLFDSWHYPVPEDLAYAIGKAIG